MNIGILGSGNVGGALGGRWAKAGHTVVFSSRDPQSEQMRKLIQSTGQNARAAGVRDAAQASEVVVLATPWPATRDALTQAGDLTGKIVIDATNPLLPDLSGLVLEPNTSAAEQIASWHPEAKVVKAFNTVGANIMENPAFPGGPALQGGKVFLPYCGEDAGAKKQVHSLAGQLGFDPFDAGPLKQARILESFALLWISIAVGTRNRDFAFQMLRR